MIVKREAVLVGKVVRRCQLKATGTLNTNAKCDIPAQCQTCPWFKSVDELNEKFDTIDKWQKLGY